MWTEAQKNVTMGSWKVDWLQTFVSITVQVWGFNAAFWLEQQHDPPYTASDWVTSLNREST